MTTTYDKDGAYIEVTIDGVVHRRSIKWEDCVVSVPGGANLKIDSTYVNESEQLVLVLEDESEITMANTEDLGTHDTDIKALLATIAAYIDTEVAAILAAVDNEVAAIEVKLDTPANFMADITALALEATLTAIKGGGWSTQTLVALKTAIDAIPTTMVGTNNAALAATLEDAMQKATNPAYNQDTDSLEALRELLDTIAGYIDTEIGDIPTASEIQTEMEENGASILDTLQDRLTADRAGYLDELAAANLPTDISTIDTVVDGIKTQTDKIANKMLFSMDFWSASLEEVSLDGDTAATITLPTVTVADLPTNATIVHAVVMFKFRMIENTHATIANKLDGATSAATSQVIQIDKTGATFIDAINFVDDQFGIAAATREGGDVIIGSIDVATEVDANDTYELRWLLALADEDLLNFNDVQVGIRIWYSV